MRRELGKVTGLLACVLIFGAAGAQERPLQAGDAAPDLTLQTLDGERIALKGADRPIVLALLAHGLGPCHALAPKLEAELAPAVKARGGLLIGAFVKGRRAAQFVRQHELSFPCAVSPELGESFDPDGLPYLVLINKEGKVAKTTRGLGQDELIGAMKAALGAD